MDGHSSLNTSRSSQAIHLNVQQLATFRLVMRHGGYAAAAKRSDLSVPSVWQHIQSLERAYNVKLFQRVGRQVEPTAAAKLLYQRVDEILERLESTFDLVQQSDEDRPIRLVTGVRMLMEDLAHPLAAFRKQHPNELVVRQGNDRRAEELLLTDEADIAMALESSLEHISQLIEYEPAYMVDFLAVAQVDHPFAQSKSVRLRELIKHDLVVTGPGTHGRDVLDEALHHAGLTPNIAVETDNSAFTIACVQAGMGVGILAGRADGELCKKLVVRSLKQSLGRRKIVFMWRKGRLLPQPITELIEHIKNAKL